MKLFYVYILASCKYGQLYIGVTNNLIGRVYDHKNKRTAGFTKTRNIHMLVYYENFDDINRAIAREKQLKKWRRDWKIKLIEKSNPQWLDLHPDLLGISKMPRFQDELCHS